MKIPSAPARRDHRPAAARRRAVRHRPARDPLDRQTPADRPSRTSTVFAVLELLVAVLMVAGVAAALVLQIVSDASAGTVDAARVAASSGGIGAVTSFAAKLTDYVTAIAASVAVLFIAINGVRWTTSGGNPSRQAEAKTGLAAAVVGLALAVSANLIVNLVLAALK